MVLHQPLTYIRFLSVCLALILNACSGGEAMKTSDPIIIFHTNDLHGRVTKWRGWEGDLKDKEMGGLDRLATVLNVARTENGNDSVLLFDAGDASGDTLLAANSKGQAVFSLFDKLGYNAMSPGNHEYDFTAKMLKQRNEEFNIRLLAANLVDSSNHKPVFEPYHIFNANGHNIGVIGLTYPKTPLTTAKKNVSGVDFLNDTQNIVQGYLSELKTQKVDYIIVLSHLGLKSDIDLARSITGIDLIIGGHSHNRMNHPIVENGTRIVQAGAHGSDVGRVELMFTKTGSVNFKYDLIPLDASIPSDPEMQQFMESLKLQYAPESDNVIAIIDEELSRAQTIAAGKPEKRDAQSPIDSFFADVIRSELETEIVFLPGVGYGIAFSKGAITEADLKNMIPHDSKLFTTTLTGRQIKEILEQSIENVFTDDSASKVGGMIQVSGLTFSYDPKKILGERTKEITIGGKELISDQIYTVATNSLLAQAGHNYKTFEKGLNRKEVSLSQYDLIYSYLKNKKRITVSHEPRILRTNF